MPGKRKQTDQELLLALAYGATVEAAALKARVSERTVYRRLNAPEFCRRLEEKKAEIVRRTGTMLNAVSLESVKTLLELQNSSQPASVRLGATRAAIYLAMKLRENLEVADRLTALEGCLEALLEGCDEQTSGGGSSVEPE